MPTLIVTTANIITTMNKRLSNTHMTQQFYNVMLIIIGSSILDLLEFDGNGKRNIFSKQSTI